MQKRHHSRVGTTWKLTQQEKPPAAQPAPGSIDWAVRRVLEEKPWRDRLLSAPAAVPPLSPTMPGQAIPAGGYASVEHPYCCPHCSSREDIALRDGKTLRCRACKKDILKPKGDPEAGEVPKKGSGLDLIAWLALSAIILGVIGLLIQSAAK